MKKAFGSMFENGTLQLLVLAVMLVAMFAFAGCKSPQKMRDIELKGMYVNGYSEVLALGWGRLRATRKLSPRTTRKTPPGCSRT